MRRKFEEEEVGADLKENSWQKFVSESSNLGVVARRGTKDFFDDRIQQRASVGLWVFGERLVLIAQSYRCTELQSHSRWGWTQTESIDRFHTNPKYSVRDRKSVV